MAIPNPPMLTSASRYIPAGTRELCSFPTMAVPGAPTAAEITAGKNLTGDLVADGLEGFSTTGDDVETPDYLSRITGKIPGMTTLDDSSIKLYASLTGTDSRQLLTDALAVNFAVFPEGRTGTVMNVFQCRIKNTNVDTVAAGEPATITHGVSVQKVWKNVAIPTA